MYIVPHNNPAPKAATTPFVATSDEIWLADTRARIKPPVNIRAAPPRTALQRARPAFLSSPKNRTPHRIPISALVFHKGNAILSPRSRIAKTVSVLATDHRQPAT